MIPNVHAAFLFLALLLAIPWNGITNDLVHFGDDPEIVGEGWGETTMSFSQCSDQDILSGGQMAHQPLNLGAIQNIDKVIHSQTRTRLLVT